MTSTSLPRVHYYEVATSQEILFSTVTGQNDEKLMGISGQFLATFSDSSIRIWDLLSQVLLGQQQELSAKVQDQLWSDLAAEDAGLAYKAIWRLSAAPEKAVALVKERLQPAPDNEMRLRRLVGDLDNGVFAIRDRASQELTEASGAAVNFLRDAANDKRHSPETKRRLQAILESLERTPLGRDELRKIRAVGLLETIASTEALALLETLAHGWSAARQTLEARESLLRLQNR